MPAPIELAPGESERVIDSPAPGDEFSIQVGGSDVFAAHRSQGIVRDGERIRAGDRATVSNLDGQSLHVKNPRTSTDTARVEVREASFALFFQPRAVQASVQASQENEAAPRTDDFRERSGDAVDVSAGAVTELIELPARADFVQVFVETGGSSITADVGFAPSTGGPFVGPQFSGSGAGAIATRVAAFASTAEIVLSGAATNVDYRIYAR